MTSKKGLAHRAGLFYALASSLAPFAYLYVPGRLIVEANAVATADRVRASEGLLRAAVAAELYGVTLLIFASLALYELFKDADRKTATLMAVMVLVSVPISYVNALANIAPLILVKNPAIAGALDPGHIAAQVTLCLRLHNYGLVVNQIFWGMWLFPIGILILKSELLPRWVAYALFAAGTGYVLNSAGAIALPPSQRWLTDNLQILGLGELPFTIYLLIWGVRGSGVDRIAAVLVVLSSAIGFTALPLLFLNRIDATGYGLLTFVSLLFLLAAVMRWRWSEKREAGGAARITV